MEKSAARRTEELRVKLAPSLSAEFSAIAQGRGVLPATLAALALGEYVEKYRRDQQLIKLVAIDSSKRMHDAFASGQFAGVHDEGSWRSVHDGCSSIRTRARKRRRGWERVKCRTGSRSRFGDVSRRDAPQAGPGEDRHLMRAHTQYAPGSG